MSIITTLPAVPAGSDSYNHYLIVFSGGEYSLQLFQDRNLVFTDDALVFSWNNSKHYTLQDDSWVLDGNPLNTRYVFSECTFVASDIDLSVGETTLVRASNPQYLKGGTVTLIGSTISDNAFYGVLKGCGDIALLVLPVLVGFFAFRKAWAFLHHTIKGA